MYLNSRIWYEVTLLLERYYLSSFSDQRNKTKTNKLWVVVDLIPILGNYVSNIKYSYVYLKI